MKCKNCGNEVNKENMFCTKCGEKIKKDKNINKIIIYPLFIMILVFILIKSIDLPKKIKLIKNNNVNILNECTFNHITPKGSTLSEKNLNKIVGWTNGGFDYTLGNISSSKLDTYYKISTVLYNLGYFSNNNLNNCVIKKSTIDKEMSNLFKDTKYNPEEFLGNDALPYEFKYDKKNKIYRIYNVGGGTGSEGYYIQKVYDEERVDNILKFKVKVLFVSAYYGEISNIDENNNFKTIEENIEIDNTYQNKIFDKYDSYANIYEYTFEKNKNGEYVFDYIERIK